MGVYLKDEVHSHTPSPINIAASLYERNIDNPVDFENDPDVQDGKSQVEAGKSASDERVGNIADDVTSASHFARPGKLVRRDYEGQFHVGPPTRDTHPASKKYIDDQQHVMADITDLPPVSRTSSVPLSLTQRTFNGNVDVPLTPTGAGDAASKNYVDQSPRVIPWSGSGTMPTIPTGSMLLDYSTGVLWGP